MKTFAIQLTLANTLLLASSAGCDAATFVAGNSNSTWNEQLPSHATNVYEQLPGAAQDLYQLPNETSQIYDNLSENIDRLVNPDHLGDVSDIAYSTRKILGGTQDLLNLPDRIKEDIKGLDILQILESAFESLLGQHLNKDLGGEKIPGGVATSSDPIANGEQLEAAIKNESSDDFDLNPTIRSVLARKQYDRTYARAKVSTVLGKAGQAAMKQANQQTLKSVLLINQADRKATAANVTQDVLKQIAQQNTQQAIIGRSLLPEAQMTNQQIAISNTNLADISSTLDTEQRAKARQANAQANAFFRQAAFQNQLWEKGY